MQSLDPHPAPYGLGCLTLMGFPNPCYSLPPSKEENPLSRSTIGLEPTEATPSFLPFEAEPSRRPVTPEIRPTPNTTETGSSYYTALHITEPFEHLVDEVLERRNRHNEEINV